MKNALANILDQLQNNPQSSETQEALTNLAKEIRHIFSKIYQCRKFEESQLLFDELEKIELVLERLVYKEKIEIPENLWQFTKDFDRIDDNDLRVYMYHEIKSDRYRL